MSPRRTAAKLIADTVLPSSMKHVDATTMIADETDSNIIDDGFYNESGNCDI